MAHNLDSLIMDASCAPADKYPMQNTYDSYWQVIHEKQCYIADIYSLIDNQCHIVPMLLANPFSSHHQCIFVYRTVITSDLMTRLIQV